MRTFIFGIGGTGARVMRSLTMLLASGAHGTGPDNSFVPIIIDYDGDNCDTKLTRRLLCDYQELNQSIYTAKLEASLNGHFFSSPVKKLKDFTADGVLLHADADFNLYLDPKTSGIIYSDYIGYKMLSQSAGLEETQNLLEALYDVAPTGDPCAELNLKLDKGFKGCPNIGCVVTRHLSESPELKKFKSIVSPHDRIVIVGSVFGGTGASGIPMLLDYIKGIPAITNVPVAVIAVTPYFNVDSDNNSAIDSATFTAKTKAALDAYNLGDSVNKQSTFIYYVGDHFKNGSYANSEGGETQKNPAHIVELAAAAMIIDFNTVDFTTGSAATHISKDVLACAREWVMNPLPNATDVDPVLRLHRFDKKTIAEPYLHPLFRFILFAKFFKKYVYPGKEQNKDVGLINSGLAANTDFKNKLNQFIDDFYTWIDEIQDPTHKRALSLFNPPAKADYNNLYIDVATSSTNIIRMTSPDINESKDIRGALNTIWERVRQDSDLSRSERYFIDAMDEITKKILSPKL